MAKWENKFLMKSAAHRVFRKFISEHVAWILRSVAAFDHLSNCAPVCKMVGGFEDICLMQMFATCKCETRLREALAIDLAHGAHDFHQSTLSAPHFSDACI